MNSFEWVKLTQNFVNSCLEDARREKVIGSSLEAHVKIEVDTKQEFDALGLVDLTELLIISTVEVVLDPMAQEPKSADYGHFNPRVTVTKSPHHKCGRCWRHLPEVIEDGALCGRCETVLSR